MVRKKNRIRYLKSFYDEAEEIAFYIQNVLCNKQAADRFITNVETAIEECSYNPEVYAVYARSSKNGLPYYRIIVGNFIILYVVLTEHGEKVMEVRHVLYGRRNISLLIFDVDE